MVSRNAYDNHITIGIKMRYTINYGNVIEVAQHILDFDYSITKFHAKVTLYYNQYKKIYTSFLNLLDKGSSTDEEYFLHYNHLLDVLTELTQKIVDDLPRDAKDELSKFVRFN